MDDGMDLPYRFDIRGYQVHGNGGHWAVRRDGKLIKEGPTRLGGPDLTNDDRIRVEADGAIQDYEAGESR